MSRLSGPKRKKIYEELAKTAGETCFIGGEPGNSSTLVVDHWDNDNKNNCWSNLHLVCRSINAIKNPRGRDHRHKIRSSLYVCDDIDAALSEPLKIRYAEFKKNQRSEPAFKHWLFEKIVKQGRVSLEVAINTGAAVASCSQETIKRYLKKEVSEVRMYKIAKNLQTDESYIEMKPEWNTFRKVSKEAETLAQQAKNWKDYD